MAFTLSQVAREIGAELKGNPDLEIADLAPIETAGPGQLSYIASGKFKKYLATTKASALIVFPGLESDKHSLLVVGDPYLGFAKAMRLFYRSFLPTTPGKHKTASIADDVEIPKDCYIGEFAVISRGARIGEGTEIHAGSFIGEDTVIGKSCRILQNVTLRERVTIGDNVVIYPGVVIGSDGFGYARTADGHLKIPQAGTVIIEDNVEIGAGTTIDRATLGETVIGKGAIIDNLVQIAHNCKIGPGAVICAQVGLAGSTIVGSNVILAGQVGVAGHLTIGEGAVIEAQSGVAGDVPPRAVHFGTPSREVYLAHKIEAGLNRLPDLIIRLKKLERLIEDK